MSVYQMAVYINAIDVYIINIVVEVVLRSVKYLYVFDIIIN